MARRSALVALSCALALLFAACTDDDETPGPSATAVGSESPSGPVDVTSSPPIFEPDDAVLDVAIPEPSTLDPMRIQDPGSVLVARQLFEGLTRWDPALEQVQPAAAEDWRVTDGGRTFIFRLRQGMTFHDGTPVTSKDFRYGFERIALKENASDLAYTLQDVAGFENANSGSARGLSGIRTPDDLTLVIRLSEPFYDFPAVLTHPGLVPISEKSIASLDEFLSVPNGNGPFRMAEAWRPGRPVLLRSFPGFIETPDLDGIRFLPFADASASYLPFVNGELDVAEVPAGQIEDAARRFGEEGFKPFLAGYYFGMNLRAGGLERESVRKAINRAIDRERIATTVYRGTLEPPRGVVPVGMPGFQENLCTSLCKYSPDIAKRLVRKVPRKDRRITLAYTREEPHDQVARLVRNDLETAGFRVKLKAFPFPKYLRHLRDGDQQVYRLGWIAEYPVADVFLNPLFGSDSPDNHSGYSSAKVDRLLEQARSEASDGRRLQLYLEAERAIMKQVPLAPIGSFVNHWAARPVVQDISFDAMGGFDAVAVSLREEE